MMHNESNSMLQTIMIMQKIVNILIIIYKTITVLWGKPFENLTTNINKSWWTAIWKIKFYSMYTWDCHHFEGEGDLIKLIQNDSKVSLQEFSNWCTLAKTGKLNGTSKLLIFSAKE